MNLNRTQIYQSASSSGHSRNRRTPGFTVIELAVVVLWLTFIALALTPVVAKTKQTTRTIQCQNNLRQLGAAWGIYAGDYNDRLANNFGVNETLASIQAGRLENWANNIMTWGASTAVSDRSNTNIVWVTNGVFGKYLGSVTSVYRCASDNYLSHVQAAAGWPARLRSVSMNSVFGRFSTGSDSTAAGLNYAFPQYVQYLKQTTVPKPAKTWLLIEEHPDSINDGYFLNNPLASSWQDIPASWHNGGCSISFVDAHTEIKRWQSRTSWYAVQLSYPAIRAFDSLGRTDFAWYLSRSGYVDAKTGQLMFNY